MNLMLKGDFKKALSETMIRAVATGVYRYIYSPPTKKKSVYLKFFMWLFCLLAMTS